ncbi:hypothetical protein WA158_002462 [Blastocystis sp. Blastoise]
MDNNDSNDDSCDDKTYELNINEDNVTQENHREISYRSAKNIKQSSRIQNGLWNQRDHLPVLLQQWCTPEGYLNSPINQRKVYSEAFNHVIQTEVEPRAKELR